MKAGILSSEDSATAALKLITRSSGKGRIWERKFPVDGPFIESDRSAGTCPGLHHQAEFAG